MIDIDWILPVAGVIINLFALLIAVSRILSSNSIMYVQAEVRAAERFTKLETKTERIEKDISALFDLTRSKN